MKYSRRIEDDTLVLSTELGQDIFWIQEKVVDDEVQILLKGELRNEIAYDLEDELLALLAVCKKLRIDFSKTLFVASAGLKVLLNTQKLIDGINGGSLILCGIKSDVEQVFIETGYINLFQIECDDIHK